ncbi:MAG TPA: HDOD domain-containing protein [Polyangiaceae bacterium]|nr:HDOD domain-containing protein [Polyangiaceae bacterium]
MTTFLQFLPSHPPAGEASEAALPLMVTAEPTPEMSEAECELVKRLRTGRAALPVLPQVAEAALRLANDPDARINDLAELVDTDPPIAARFMSVANSVAYWRGLLTSSTQSAIVRLGLANTRDLLFQVVYAASAGGLKRYQVQVQKSFKRSVVAAVAARTAARELGIESEYDYMSGLLHDIGEARIYRILDGLPNRVSDAKLVTDLVQRYHTAAGAEVAMAWKLPTEIVDACAAHHDPQAASVPHVRLVMIADAVVDALEAGRTPNLERFESLLVDVGVARRIIELTKAQATISVRP